MKLPLNLTDQCLVFNCPWKDITVRKAQYQNPNLSAFIQGFISGSRYLVLQAVTLTRLERRCHPPVQERIPPRCHLYVQGEGTSCKASLHFSFEKKAFSEVQNEIGKQSRDYFLTPQGWRIEISPPRLLDGWSFSGKDTEACVICLWSAENTYFIDLRRWKKKGLCAYHFLHVQKCKSWKKLNLKSKMQKFRSDQKFCNDDFW